MTEFNPSLAPRSQMKRIFLPFKPMLPSASARFMTNGMSTSVDSATAMLVLNDWLKKARRERILKCLYCCISLLLLETGESHQHRHHAPQAGIVIGGRVAQKVEGR